MSLAAGVRLGPYEIVALLGAGGMGVVYRARDTRLGRDVAVKVLPAGFAADPDRLQRFEQEARAAAALNHPGILAVHDIGRHDEAPFIVSELLEGETLRARLHAGALPVRKAIDYAVQIAHGLAAAHEKAITHRDIKPENLFVTTDERVKILDFGLAKLTQVEPAFANLSQLPTMPAFDPAQARAFGPADGRPFDAAQGRPDTVPGMVLGTIGYMSPEQVRGAAADHRADVFAFGAVLYEMLAGRRAFLAATPADVMSAILREDPPDLPVTERHIPPALARIVGRCLEKNPAARFQSTRDLAFALEALSTHSESSAAGVRGDTAPMLPKKTARLARERVVGALALLFLLTTLGLAGWMSRPAPEPAVIRFSVSPPEGTRFGAFALSPDGRQLAFVASVTGDTSGEPSQLYVRSLDAVSARPLEGTERAQNPFWAPDGRAIGFFADGKLKTVDTSDGVVRTICDAVGARTWGDWSQDGVIVFSTESTQPIRRVSADGGQPVPVTTVGESRGHVRPTFLPGGRRFLYLAMGAGPPSDLRLASLDSTEDALVLKTSGWARYGDPGYLVFVRGRELVAQPFDATTGALSGRAITIGAVGAMFNSGGNTDESGFSVSGAGMLAFRTLEQEANNQLVWFSRSGDRLSTLGQSGQYRNLHLSPDTSRLAVQQTDESGRPVVWLFDLARGIKTRLTLDVQDGHQLPLWSPDGSNITMKSTAPRGVFRVPVAGAGEAEVLSTTTFDPNSYSPDGRFLAYTVLNSQTNRDVGVMPLVGDRKPFLLLQSTANEVHGQISPDGRWIAYESDESGAYDTYVQSFPKGGQKLRVSESGGLQPRWRRDGRELYFLDPAGRVMATSVQSLPELRVGRPQPLFQSNVVAVVGGVGTNAHYDVTPDGQRFIISSRASDIADPPITVVLNWQAALDGK